MSIQQFNATYVPSEDRVLFRFNTSDSCEYRLWLTRRMTLQLLAGAAQSCISLIASATQSISTPETAKTIDTFQQEALKQEVNLKTEYRVANKLPLGADPVLVTAFSIRNLDDANINLCLKLINRKNLDLKQSISMLNKLRLLLQQIVANAEWSAPTSDPVQSPLPAPGSRAVH